MKNIIYVLMLSIFLFGCNSDDEKPKTRTVINETVNEENTEEIENISDNESDKANTLPETKQDDLSDIDNMEIETITIIETAPAKTITVEVPVIIEPEPEIIPEPEEKIMIAVLFYDNSLKYLNDDYTLDIIQDADNVTKAGDYYLIDNGFKKLTLKTIIPITVPAKKSVMYGDNLFYYGIDDKLYMYDFIKKESIIIYNNVNNYNVALTDNGIVIGFTFFFSDGSFETGQYWAHDAVIKLEKIGSVYHKHARVNNDWLKVGEGFYSNFVKGSALILPDKIIFSGSATLENDILTEPVYNGALGLYQGGNAFQAYIQPGTAKCLFHAIGYINDTGYFLNARDGKVYKYDIPGDKLTAWIEIAIGTGNYDSVDSENLFNMVNPVIVGNDIIYFNGTVINRVEVDTGVKTEIAEATNFKGWSL